MRIGRLLIRLVLAGLIAVGLLWPLLAGLSVSDGSSAPSDPVTITKYHATYEVAADGTLNAVEDITASFPWGRHGIFRYWDLADTADPGVRYQPDILSITQDGAPATYETSWQSGSRFLVAKIGDADTYLSEGVHRYQIRYRIEGAISPVAAGSASTFASSAGTNDAVARSVFLWAVVARGWEMPMEKATAVVTLPAQSGRVQCSVGAAGGEGPCTISGEGTEQITLSATDLPARSGMVARIGMATPVPDRVSLPWPVAWDPVLGRSPARLVVVLIVAAIALMAGVAWARTAREEEPGFPVQYTPPDGLGPVQTVYMHTEAVGSAPLVATLMHLAERGLVRLDRDSADVWTVTGLAPAQAWAAVDPVSAGLAARLGVTGGGTFRTSRSAAAGKSLQAADNAISGDTRTWAAEAGLVRTAAGETWGRVLWVGCLLLAVAGFAGLAWPTVAGLPFAAFVLGGIGLLATGVGRRRTLTGRTVWSQAGGFRRLLATPSAEDRFDFAARQDLFIAYVPYAVAFGVADRWAQKYRTAVGAEPPLPVWYPYAPGMTSSSFYDGGGVGSFSAAVTSSIAAYTATQSSSSGGGGGGFSGGGGGGGGGGSW